jgi:glycosyltransferase involved in cell wall biosynthesis
MISPLPLSVAIIAKNEERKIKRCLGSLRDIASEIILVYNDCTDKTVEVAESFGAKCFENKWCGHIEQKNFALNKCTYSWILCIDADEALSRKLKISIKNFIKNEEKNQQYDGALFNRCSFFLGKWIRHGDWYPDKKIRIVRNGKASWYGKNPHDKIILNDKGKSKLLKGDLLHYSYNNLREIPIKAIAFSDLYIANTKNAGFQNLFISSVLRPFWRFFRSYILRLGFLDGSAGFVIALSIAYETMLRHGRLWERVNLNIEIDKIQK